MTANPTCSRSRLRRGLAAAALASVLALAQVAPAAAEDSTLTIAPATPSGGSCFPFGQGVGWPPYAGFVYKNIPPFELRAGDTIAFDLTMPNNASPLLRIEATPAAENGATDAFEPFTPLVPNTQAPSGVGNSVAGDFDLAYLVGPTSFSFPGGGLILRFSQPSASYAADGSCNNVLKGGSSADASGYLVSRFRGDSDGEFPYPNEFTTNVAGFRLAFNRTCAGKPVTLRGTDQRQVIRGTSGPDVIAVYGDADTVFGRGGRDVICGGDGKDRLLGGGGNDRLLGEAGKDILRGNAGKDRLKGGPGKDSQRQ